MATFSSRNVSIADVPASRDDIWQVLVDPILLAKLTPLVRRIDAVGEVWRWHLSGISALGVTVEPTFTEQMTFVEPSEIVFAHRPPDGKSERAGANGVYRLSALDDARTRLSIDITLCVELPLPRLSRRVVEGVMGASMQRTGLRFAANLYAHLGIDPALVTVDGAGTTP